MLVFREQLLSFAVEAGMAIPPDPNEFELNDFPHFAAFCMCQLHREMEWSEPLENAKKLVAVPAAKILQMNWQDFVELGVYPDTAKSMPQINRRW